MIVSSLLRLQVRPAGALIRSWRSTSARSGHPANEAALRSIVSWPRKPSAQAERGDADYPFVLDDAGKVSSASAIAERGASLNWYNSPSAFTASVPAELSTSIARSCFWPTTRPGNSEPGPPALPSPTTRSGPQRSQLLARFLFIAEVPPP